MQEVRKKENVIYGNWLVLHPQGFEMFRCTSRKANWYISRNLADVVSENPPIIKFNFSPNGVGWNGDEFALTQKKNQCVVCGVEEIERLTKHHIVPTLYKRHFPKELKVASGHDVACICRECHDEYENIYATKLKSKISEEYGIPLCNSQSDFLRAIKLSKAFVLNSEMMSEERRVELLFRMSIMMGYEQDFIEIEEVEKLSKITTHQYSEFHNNHGKEVMQKVIDIQKFVEMWRLDFMNNMKPKFMSEHWEIYRPIIRSRT